MMRLKSFGTQEVRKLDRKEAGESRGFPILWMGIIENVSQMEGKKYKRPENMKNVKTKKHVVARKVR